MGDLGPGLGSCPFLDGTIEAACDLDVMEVNWRWEDGLDGLLVQGPENSS